MGILDSLRRIFGKKQSSEAIQSDLESILKRSAIAIPTEPPIELQRDSLQLGVAAGYTGRAIKEIESSLSRIESQMTTKDWISSKFEGNITELVTLMKKHEENEERRFEAIQNSLYELLGAAKTEAIPKVEPAVKLPLTSRMREILQIIKQAGEMSYEDLAMKLNLEKVSGLRGLLSEMVKRTNEIERFTKDRKGWVRYIGKSDLNRFESEEETTGEALLRSKFEAVAQKQGIKIIKRLYHTAPDFIIEENNKKIGVELKVSADTSSLEKTLGQLIFAKKTYDLQETWLVIPRQVQALPEIWLGMFNSQNIKILVLEDDKLVEYKAHE